VRLCDHLFVTFVLLTREVKHLNNVGGVSGFVKHLEKCRAYDTWSNLSAPSSHHIKCILKFHLKWMEAGFVTPIPA
jgi:hypothetical protein